MKIFKKNLFSLIEIILALTVLSVGIVSIMTLFPAGLSENKKSIVQNNAAHSAEGMFAYISNNISKSSNEWNAFVDTFPTSKPETILTGSEDLASLTGNLYDYEDQNGVYAVKLKTGTHNDMTGEVLVWTSPIQKAYFAGEQITTNEGEPGFDTDSILGVNIELSFPVQKPYDKRDKFQYYFEAYNKNMAENEEETGPLFDENEGVVTVKYKSVLSVEVLGTFFAYSDGTKAFVFLQLEVIDPDGNSTISSPFNEGSTVLGEGADTALGEDPATPGVYTQNVEPGTQFRISAKGQCRYNSRTIYGPYWSDNPMQADALIDGQVPFPYTPAGSQPGFTTFITDYLSEETGEVTIDDHEILFLFELNSVPKSHKAYDMQDLVVIAGIERIAISSEELAAKTAMDDAKITMDAAETTMDMASIGKSTTLSALNNTKNSANYNNKNRARNKKYTAWQNAIIKYDNDSTEKKPQREE